MKKSQTLRTKLPKIDVKRYKQPADHTIARGAWDKDLSYYSDELNKLFMFPHSNTPLQDDRHAIYILTDFIRRVTSFEPEKTGKFYQPPHAKTRAYYAMLDNIVFLLVTRIASNTNEFTIIKQCKFCNRWVMPESMTIQRIEDITYLHKSNAQYKYHKHTLFEKFKALFGVRPPKCV